jgi:hypothetical protein
MKSKIHNHQNKNLMMSKNTTTLLIIFLITMSSFAQQGFNYKAVIKDDQGNVVVNQNVTIQFTILDALSGGGIESQETHYAIMPDANGIVIAIIGEGTQSLSYGLFNDINWGSHAHYVQVGIDITGGTNFEGMGTSEFMAVPYAKYANRAGAADNVSTKIDDLSDGKSDSNGSSLFIGKNAGFYDDGTSNENVGIGFLALSENITGGDNTAIGTRALSKNTEGSFNTALGQDALRDNITGDSNTALGEAALRDNITGYSNTALGADALQENTFGTRNIAVGREALEKNTIGSFNVALGSDSLEFLTGENDSNTAVGQSALNRLISGNGNVAIGRGAGLENPSGSNNIYIGFEAGGTNNLSENDKLYINNNKSINPLIYGEFDTGLVRINGTLDVTEKINREATGNTNLVPIAYGSVNGSANLGIVGRTGNFSVTRNSTTNEYTINVTDQTLDLTNTVASVVSNT